MKSKAPLIILLSAFILVFGCNRSTPVIEDTEAYFSSVEQWQKDRLEKLKSKDGWLNLAGIYWLKEGEQTIGSHPSNDHVFPERAPAFLGTLTLEDALAHIRFHEEVDAYYKNQKAEALELRPHTTGQPSYITHGDFAWYNMKRHQSLAIRLRDFENPAIADLDHIPSYPINPDYVVEAELIPFDSARTITVPTPFQDYTQDYQCPGELEFKLLGQKLKLLPFISGEGFFIIISDETSAQETYGGGRFMYTYPDSTGRIILDFNKAYNPPCAITPYAACPMPPRENHLPLRIEAGEKTIKGH